MTKVESVCGLKATCCAGTYRLPMQGDIDIAERTKINQSAFFGGAFKAKLLSYAAYLMTRKSSMLSGDLSLLLKICQFHLEKRHGPTGYRKINLTETWRDKVSEGRREGGKSSIWRLILFRTQGASEWSK